MIIPPNVALKELDDIRQKLEEVNQKSYGRLHGNKKREDILKLVRALDMILRSSDLEYEKGEMIKNAPKPKILRVMGEEQEFEASADKWYGYLVEQLDLYKKRFELLDKSTPTNNIKTEKSPATQVFENVGTYIHYNPEVNISNMIQNIDHIISELDKEPNLDSKSKEEIKSKLQHAKDFIKNAANEAAPIAGKFVGKALRSFLFGKEE